MKRILYSCLLFLSLLISSNIKAQAFNFSLSPNVICYTGPGTYTAGGAVTATLAGASTYSWTFIPPTGGTAAVNYSPSPVNGTNVALSFTGCGIYQVNIAGYAPGNIFISQISQTLQIVCPTAGTITTSTPNPTVQSICAGSSVTLTGVGAATYVWLATTAGVTSTLGTGTNIVVSPTANTSYTFVGTTVQGCTVTASRSYSVQSATLSVSPMSPTVCQGQPVSFNSTVTVTSGTNVAAGTTTSGIQWFNPNNTQFSATPNVTTAAIAGFYNVVLTHTGSAGSCTIGVSPLVSTVSTVSLNAGTPTPSVCPGAAATLTAGLAAPNSTAAGGYTWTAPTGPASVGNPIVKNPLVATIYTVNVTFYGCTGTNTVAIAMATITPTLTSSTPSTCPSRSLSLTFQGGINYTLIAIPNNAPPNLTLSTGAATSIVHSPSNAQLPITYSLIANSSGCMGTSTLQINKLILNTTLTPSTYSVCPNRSITLSVNNGATSTWTITNVTYNVNYTGTNTAPYTPLSTQTTSSVFYPITYTATVDSLGCRGTSTVQIWSRSLSPTLTPSSFSICPGRTLTLSSSGGAGTNYTFTAPYVVTGPSSSIIPNGASTTNSVSSVPPNQASFLYTYSVSVDSAGCVGTATVDIGLLPLMPTLTASSQSICPGSTFTLTSTGGTGTTYTFTAPYVIPPSTINVIPNSGPTDNQAIHAAPTSSASFPHTYTVVVDSAGCVGTATLSMGLLSISNNLSLTASSNSVCPNTNFTLNASGGGVGTTYSFSTIQSVVITTISPNQATSICSSTAFPLPIIVTSDSLGCKGTKTININQRYLNNLSLIASPNLVCAGMPSTLIASVPGFTNTAGYSYTFAALSPSAPITSGTSFSTVINPTVQTIVICIADSAGCTTPIPPVATQTAIINIRPILTLTPSASSASVCAGLSTTLSVAGPSNNITYTWSPMGPTNFGTLTVGAPPSASAVANPTTTVTYTIDGKDALGCIGSTVITIGIDPTASLTVGLAASANTICPGLTTSLTATCNINPVTFTWSPSLSVSINTGSAVNAFPSISTVYTVVAGNGWGCFGTANYSITVSSYPQPTITATSNAICAGYTGTLTAFGAASYTWTVPNSTTSVAQASISVSPPPTSLTPATYSLILSNGGGCITTTTYPVYLAPPLNIQVLPNGSYTTCITNNDPKYSKPIILSASGANTYVWFPYNPIHMTYSLGPSTTIRPPASTQYTITGSTSAPAACSGSTTIDITVIPQFTMNVVPPLPAMCFGDSLKLSIVNIQTTAVGPTSAFQYSWTAPVPQIMTGDNTSALTPTLMVYPQTTTTFSSEVRDSRNCVSLPRLVTVTVLPRPLTAIAIPTINNVPTNTVCYVGLNPGPSDVVLDLIGVNQNTNLQFGVVPTYTWVSPYAKYPSILTPVNLPKVTISAPVRAPSVVIYTLISGYNGVPGCYREDTISIRVIDCRPVTAVSFTTADQIDTICARHCITFINTTDTAAGGPQTFTWTFPGGNPSKSTSSLVTVCYNLPNTYNVFLTVANQYPISPPNGAKPGSEKTYGIQSFVKVVDVPNVTIIAPGQLRSDTTIRFGQEVKLRGTGANTYSWSPPYSITSTYDPFVTVNPIKTTQYILTGKNSSQCYSSDTLNVIVIEDCGEMFVPNAFSPNGDGHNDELKVNGICLESLTFMIFNRWGEKVFETNDQKIGWDGTYKGEALNTGIFVYRLEGKNYEGKAFSSKGNITLMR